MEGCTSNDTRGEPGRRDMIIELLTSRLKEHFDKDSREGVHVSDLTLCIRKAAFKKFEPTPSTMRDVNFFTSGRAIHDAIQTLAQYEKDRFEIEKPIEYEGIVGHIDLYDKINNIPIECKSSRVKTVSKPKSFHVDQLKCYMAITGADIGIILYQCLIHFDDTPFVEFEIKMTKEEREQQLMNMSVRRDYFKHALFTKDPLSINGVLDNPDLNWMCVTREGVANCPYYQKCKGDKI